MLAPDCRGRAVLEIPFCLGSGYSTAVPGRVFDKHDKEILPHGIQRNTIFSIAVVHRAHGRRPHVFSKVEL